MNSGEQKDFKQAARDAKKRLKTGFWANYGKDVVKNVEISKRDGVNASKIIEYYESKTLHKAKSDDEFYEKVKKMVDSEGEVGNAIGRLIDYAVYDELNYDAKQKYIFELSEKYREALIRYHREKMLDSEH